MKPRDEIIYTSQKTGLEKGRRYANPRFFGGKARSGITKCIVVGNWPEVVAAYRGAGIEVEIVKQERAKGNLMAPVNSFPREPEKVDIPADYRERDWNEIRKMASDVSPVPAINREQAIASIEAELERRGDEYPSDDELRAAIEEKTGKRPHWKAKRETLIEQLKATEE